MYDTALGPIIPSQKYSRFYLFVYLPPWFTIVAILSTLLTLLYRQLDKISSLFNGLLTLFSRYLCTAASSELESLAVDTVNDGVSLVALDYSTNEVIGVAFNKIQVCSLRKNTFCTLHIDLLPCTLPKSVLVRCALLYCSDTHYQSE